MDHVGRVPYLQPLALSLLYFSHLPGLTSPPQGGSTSTQNSPVSMLPNLVRKFLWGELRQYTPLQADAAFLG